MDSNEFGENTSSGGKPQLLKQYAELINVLKQMKAIDVDYEKLATEYFKP
jgi:hypothetical protein